MMEKKTRPYTVLRREKVFETYKELIQKEISEAEANKKPNRAKSLSKAYLYQEVAEITGYDPIYVARLIQQKLKEKGMNRERHTKMTEIMDEEIRFILNH